MRRKWGTSLEPRLGLKLDGNHLVELWLLGLGQAKLRTKTGLPPFLFLVLVSITLFYTSLTGDLAKTSSTSGPAAFKSKKPVRLRDSDVCPSDAVQASRPVGPAEPKGNKRQPVFRFILKHDSIIKLVVISIVFTIGAPVEKSFSSE